MALSHLLDTLRPRLLTEAAHGGLKPSPTERLRRVLLHLSYSMALSHLLDTILPQLLTEAAHGGLKPSPTGRLRRVLLHLSYSMALSHLLDTSRVGPGSFTPSTGSPEAVARPRFPQNVACGFPAPTLFGSCFTALRCYLFKFRFHGQLDLLFE